jgi:CRISPR-associated protein Cmr1
MAALRFLDLEVQAVTPLIIGGASFAPELRPPSFRGGMRLWLRALIGGLLGDDLDSIRTVERATFGYAGHASPIAVRAQGAPRSGPLPVDPDAHPGVQYMLWSAYRLRREALLPGESFRIRLQTRPIPPPAAGQWSLGSDEALTMALISFWLLARLGGVGARIRRGAGGVQMFTHPPDWPSELPSPVVEATTPANLVNELADELSEVRRFINWTPASPVSSPSTFNLLHPQTCELYVLDRSFSTWWEALDVVGAAFKAFRLRQPDDYQGIKAILTRGRVILPTVKRAVFGLPLSFFFSSLYKQLVERGLPEQEARTQASATVLPRGGDRRASPLFFRVLSLPASAGPCYAVVVGLFRARFLPDDSLVVRPRDRSLRPFYCAAPTDYSFVREWLAYLGQEVAPLLQVEYR